LPDSSPFSAHFASLKGRFRHLKASGYDDLKKWEDEIIEWAEDNETLKQIVEIESAQMWTST
jgi:hypothetical protein